MIPQCDGNIPCRTCEDKGLECVVDPTKDRRRLRKRTLDDIATRADALDTLVESLRTSDDKTVQSLLQFVRDGASVTEVVQRAKAMLGRDGIRTTHRARRTILDIATLIDEPPIRVPAKPWTEVTGDDSAVSHLVSVFFAWHHFGYPSVDATVFVKEMNSKNTSNQFCSPLLVNSILSIACVGRFFLSMAVPMNNSNRCIQTMMLHLLRLATSQAGECIFWMKQYASGD